MYLPAHFAQHDRQALQAFIAAHPLGALVRHGPDGLDADHLPFLLDRDGGAQGRLVAHVARANPLWREAAAAGTDGLPVLAVFRAEQAYVSPGWYPSKAATHKAVPTWNYAVAHAHGRLSAIDDAGWLRQFLGELTGRHEAAMPKPWSMADAPEDFLAQMLAAVVGIEIRVERLEGKAKLSQNRAATDQQGVIDGMRADGPPAAQPMAERMARGRGPG